MQYLVVLVRPQVLGHNVIDVMWRLARFTDLGELFPDAPYEGHVEVAKVY
jgi:hypothetical protein